MSDQTVLEVLIRAMITEQDGYDFYMAATDRVADEKGKTMLKGLANDEIEHLHILQSEYNKVKGGESFVDLESARANLPPEPGMRLFPEKSNLGAMLEAVTNDEQALRVALEFELKGYEMYNKAAQDADDENAREVFAYLAKQEDGHYELIQQTLNYLVDDGLWFFQDGELPMFEG
jgi:rubrerythrin